MINRTSLALASALASGLTVRASAQVVCKTATPTAIAAVDNFLASSNARPWLTAHGIVATSAVGLRALNDSMDTARCQQMTPQASLPPVYLFAAGAYVIVTNAKPLTPDSAGVFHIREGQPNVFVYDSSKTMVFAIGLVEKQSSSPALGRSQWTVSASDTWAYGGALTDAIDGSVGSYWKSGVAVTPGVTYFSIDTHTSQTIGSLRVNDSQFASEIPLAGNVLVSTNGSSYTQVAQWTSENIADGLLEVSWYPTPARYVKLVATQPPAVSSNWFTIADVRLYASLPEILWTGSASGSGYGDPIPSAFDGNVGTRWSSGNAVTPNATFIVLDAHTTASFGSLRLDDTQFSGGIPLTGDVLLSTNGSEFTRVAQWSAANIASNVLTLSWTAQPARYIKLMATSTPSASTSWWSIGELTIAP